jgi:hypothetical protein
VQGGGRRGPVKGGSHRLAIQRDKGPFGELCDGLGPGQEALLKALRVEACKHAAKGVMRGNPMRQGQEGLQPWQLALAKEFHILKAFPTSQQGAQGNDQNIKEVVLLGPVNARVLSVSEMLDNRRINVDRHGVRSSVDTYGEEHSRGTFTGAMASALKCDYPAAAGGGVDLGSKHGHTR